MIQISLRRVNFSGNYKFQPIPIPLYNNRGEGGVGVYTCGWPVLISSLLIFFFFLFYLFAATTVFNMS